MSQRKKPVPKFRRRTRAKFTATVNGDKVAVTTLEDPKAPTAPISLKGFAAAFEPADTFTRGWWIAQGLDELEPKKKAQTKDETPTHS